MPKTLEKMFQFEFAKLLSEICEAHKFSGLRLKVLVGQPRVDNREPDIVVVKKPEEIPVLVIETKRKIERDRRVAKEKFSPHSPPVIGQALSYATLMKEMYRMPATPLFATANLDALVLFGPVDSPWKYLDKQSVKEGDYEKALKPGAFLRLIKEHYIFDDVNPLREELAVNLLDIVTRIWLKEVAITDVRKPLGWWIIDQLRYFVDSLSRYYVVEILRSRLRDPKFYAKLDDLARRLGYKNGLADIVGEDLSKVDILARMMTYVLMNKIVFYKVLEGYYDLPELRPFSSESKSALEYLSRLNDYFKEAIKVTGDFEQIFETGLYDHIVLADRIEALEQIDDLIRTLSEVDLRELGDVIGQVYEDLIPAEERHRMGQFYTPRPIAELITRWCIRSPDDYVLGPGCGSGTFEVESYWRLVELKLGRKQLPPTNVHKRILKQIYAVDINSFPTQLTAMNLAMKNVLAPVSDLNVIESDFFALVPGQDYIAPYKVVTSEGEKKKIIKFPEQGFDAIVGNPPYTRWMEIPERVRDNIKDRIGHILSKYSLRANMARGKESGLFVHFIIWSHQFLKPGGRLGMIISDSWLQAVYGEYFGRYLLENFKVKGLIDISARVFPVPLIGTCIILLEKPREGETVDENEAVFIYLHVPEGGSFKVDELLDAIENPGNALDKFWIKVYTQGDIPKNKRWIDLLFNTDDFFNILERSQVICKLSDFFEPCRGNTLYQILVNRKIVRSFRDVGGESFFYLSESEAGKQGLIPDWVHPLLPSTNYMRFYTFTREDWEEIRRKGGECYLFLAHKPRDQLPKNVQDYISKGETSIYLRRRKGESKPRTVNESQASQARMKYPQYFHGWYDLGGVIQAPIYAAYGVQYLVRFTLAKFHAALDHRILSLIPKNGITLNQDELKALLAFLNSSWTQLQVEARGRITGGGMLELDVNPLSNLLITDPRKLNIQDKEKLATLFDKLENEARRLGGADSRENAEALFDSVIKEIDYAIAEILGVSKMKVEELRTMIKLMMERRLARAGEARREAIKGSEEEKLLRSPKRRKGRRGRKSSGAYVERTLDKYL